MVLPYVFYLSGLCPPWANPFPVFKSLARRGQTPFRFRKPLPASGKPVFISKYPCPRRASHLFFHFTFARTGQALFILISPLPAAGKQVISGKEARSTLDKQLYSIRATTPQRDIAEYRQYPRLRWCERQPSFITLILFVVI